MTEPKTPKTEKKLKSYSHYANKDKLLSVRVQSEVFEDCIAEFAKKFRYSKPSYGDLISYLLLAYAFKQEISSTDPDKGSYW